MPSNTVLAVAFLALLATPQPALSPAPKPQLYASALSAVPAFAMKTGRQIAGTALRTSGAARR